MKLREVLAATAWAGLLILALSWTWCHFLEVTPFRNWPYLKGSDSNFYFAWGRSIALDGDVDFRNDLEFITRAKIGGPEKAFESYLRNRPEAPTGLIKNKYGIGSGLLAVPALKAAQMYAHSKGPAYSPFSPIFPLIYLLNQICLGFLGILVIYFLLRRLYGPEIAVWAAATATLGLSLTYYLFFEPAMAHLGGFCLGAVALAILAGWGNKLDQALSAGRISNLLVRSLLLGISLGVAAMIRNANGALALGVVAYAFIWVRQQPPGLRKRALAIVIIGLIGAGAGALIGFFPQFAAWKIIYGSWLVYSYQNEVINPFPSHALAVLFGKGNGLFVYTPLVFAAVLGLLLGRKSSKLAAAGLAVFAGFIYIYGGWSGLGPSYGMRGFIDMSAYFYLGLAELLRIGFGVNKLRIRGWLAALFCVAAVLLNLYFISAYRAGMLRPNKLLSGAAFHPNDRWHKQFGTMYRNFQAPRFPLLMREQDSAPAS